MPTAPLPPPRPGHFIFEAKARSIVAIAAGVLGFLVTRRFASGATAFVASWDSFALALLVLIWYTILTSGLDLIRHRAQTQDLSRLLIFIFTVGAACSSIFAVVALLSAAKNTNFLALHAVLSGLAVVSAWALVHTMFTLRYAHGYYGEEDSKNTPAGGLEFPSDDHPDYLDFAYFSFVIGMTCQVSDVQISAKGLRTLALVHGILSFGFNTVILALTINTISGLL